MQMMLAEFKSADVDKCGVLNAVDFRQCIQTLDLGLTRQEIGFISYNLDPNQSGDTLLITLYVLTKTRIWPGSGFAH